MWQSGWKGAWGSMDTCIRMAESLCWLLEMITTSLISYVVVQSLSHDQLFVTPWAAACQAPLSFTISRGLPKFMSVELVISSNHLILSPPSPPALSLSQPQDLFQWVSCLHQVAKVLELSPRQNKMLNKSRSWDLSDKEVTERRQKRTPGEGAVLGEAPRWAWARGQWAPQPMQRCPKSWGQERPEGGRASSPRDLQGKVTSSHQILQEWRENSCYKGPESI